jgi:hypothetical protein
MASAEHEMMFFRDLRRTLAMLDDEVGKVDPLSWLRLGEVDNAIVVRINASLLPLTISTRAPE